VSGVRKALFMGMGFARHVGKIAKNATHKVNALPANILLLETIMVDVSNAGIGPFLIERLMRVVHVWRTVRNVMVGGVVRGVILAFLLIKSGGSVVLRHVRKGHTSTPAP
jgi:hypothetical protein